MSSWVIAIALNFTPNFQKAIVAAKEIFELLNEPSNIQTIPKDIHEKWKKGSINYKKLNFTYPSRPDVKVLQEINMSISPRKMVAVVGPSGGGKSTIIELLQRLYDPTNGQICIGRMNIKKLNLSSLRNSLGIVSQESGVFNRTLTDNIAYGDNSRSVTMEEIIAAARAANIHNFIKSLPLGYETVLGTKGIQLSGGQRQRIAIARAMVRDPKVLLLDEATSALDAESEKIVQQALDSAVENRTCIVIAHRLSTILHADIIYVISEGKIIEQGTHQELFQNRGMYYSLYSTQNNSREYKLEE